MSVAAPGAFPAPPTGPFRGLTVAEYHHLIQAGYLTDEDKVELLNGFLVRKMPRNPPHDATFLATQEALRAMVPGGWCIRGQCAITLASSEPEPDIVIARGRVKDYVTRHPGPADITLVAEVADSSLTRDRSDKGPIYAAAGLVIYWIVNIVDRQVEVYTKPAGTGATARYTGRQDYRPGDAVPFSLDGTVVGHIAVQDLLP
jgi:Uma2 family endonuclease